ncbi:MAG: CmcJ/NvfI family oxidoreductase [Minwuia sp.]|uniref:CmcJ/NvfI family oxidoreductase n=1 Tax=Minwuia sp. TaxID=2493630 RepID=UPI003A8A0D10
MLNTAEVRETRAPVAEDFVEADVVYTPEDGRRHQVFIPPMGSGAYRRSHPDMPTTVKIHNGWPHQDDINLEEHGIALREAPTAVKDFFDNAEVEQVYYPEVEALLKRETGASRVIIFDHTIRIDDGDRSAALGQRLPVRRAHVDYTVKSGPQRVRDLAPEEADDLLSRRVSEINVWRSIAGTVQRAPLAVAEATSIAFEDLIATDLVYDDRVGEIYEFAHKPGHRWTYFPDMTADEVLLLKSYDSETDGRARFTPHTAFDHPGTPADAPARESIEVRAFLFFDE